MEWNIKQSVKFISLFKSNYEYDKFIKGHFDIMNDQNINSNKAKILLLKQ